MYISSLLSRPGSAPVAKAAGVAALVSRLCSLCKLSAEEVALLHDLGRLTRAHPARSEIWNGAEPGRARILVSGWACRQRILGDGRRQIINFVLPGDAVGDWAQPGLRADSSTAALTEVVTADASALVAAAQRGRDGLAGLLRQMASLETALLHDHIVRLGRQTAYERMTHLMLEFHARLHAAGMAAGERFAMPLTQETLADSLGLSVVHVNRTLMQMRRDGLLQMALGHVRIIDLKLMRAVADWAPMGLEPKRSWHPDVASH